MTTATAATARTILALDLGKYMTVAGIDDSAAVAKQVFLTLPMSVTLTKTI
jgi:hypothetical protein